MLKRSVFSIALIFSLLSGINANAYIFNPPIDYCAYTEGGGWWGNVGANCGTSSFQGSNVAYQFTLEAPIYVSAIEGWVSYSDPFNDGRLGGANIVLYNNTIIPPQESRGFIPSGEQIFSKHFSVLPIDNNVTQPNWRGVNDISLELEPGTYWVAFEDGAPGTIVSSPIRMEAVNTPEPTTMALMGMGLAGVIWRRRKVSKV